MRVPAHACMCVEGNKHIGMIHQLSTLISVLGA